MPALFVGGAEGRRLKSLAAPGASARVVVPREGGSGDDDERHHGSCNAIFPKLGRIPKRNKDLVLTRPDAHGTPALSAPHGVCAAPKGLADAYDWNFCWKVWDGLRDCAYFGTHCKYALGNTRQHRSNGRWSDGVPIAPLKIQDRAPIRPWRGAAPRTGIARASPGLRDLRSTRSPDDERERPSRRRLGRPDRPANGSHGRKRSRLMRRCYVRRA